MRPGIDYMLSTENITVVDAEKGIVAPYPAHVMFYGPYMTNADLGSDGNPRGPAFVAGEGTPHALIIAMARTRSQISINRAPSINISAAENQLSGFDTAGHPINFLSAVADVFGFWNTQSSVKISSIAALRQVGSFAPKTS